MLQRTMWIVGLLLLLTTGMVAASDGVVIMQDDFELYLAQPAFEAVWRTTDGRAMVRLSDEANRTPAGLQSIKILPQTGAVMGLPGEQRDVQIAVHLLSGGPEATERGIVRVRWSGSPVGARDLLVGVWPGRDVFVVRDTLAGTGWEPTSAERKAGWHEIAVRISDQGAEVRIDGEIVYENADFLGANSISALDLWSDPEDEVLPVYMDDLLVTVFGD